MIVANHKTRSHQLTIFGLVNNVNFYNSFNIDFLNKLQIYKCLSWVASENSSKCLWLSFWKTCFICLYLLLRSNSYIFSWFWWINETRWTVIMICWMLVTMLLSSVWIFKNATTDLQSHSYSPNWKKMQPKSLMSPGILNG